MRETIEKYIPELKDLKKIKEALKECKDEWLETKPGSGKKPASNYMGVNTVRQIIDAAVDGYTYWDFGITDQWREEVYKLSQDKSTWNFDGYVYHVKAYLFIPGLGHKEQYGCKIAIGGKDNQDSAYKSATSNALVKTASLFGVGESIYSKIKVEAEEDANAYNDLQNNAQDYMMQPEQQTHQQTQQQAVQYPNYNNQNNYQDNYQQPQQQWQQPQNEQQQQQWPQNTNINVSNFDANNPESYPFNVHPEGSIESQQWQTQYGQQTNPPQQEQFTPQPQNVPVEQHSFVAQPNPNVAQPQASAAAIQPGTFTAPVETTQAQSAIPKEWNPEEMVKIQNHKARLNIQSNEGMLPYLREYLRKEEAEIKDLTPDNLQGFNTFLEKYQA